MEIKTPWHDLPLVPPYVLPQDKAVFRKFNERFGAKNEKATLQANSLPEPFIGDIANEKVLLLLANPGHSTYDTEAHKLSKFRDPILANLRQEPREYPCYILDPALKDSPASIYWLARLRRVLEGRDLGILPEIFLTPQLNSERRSMLRN